MIRRPLLYILVLAACSAGSTGGEPEVSLPSPDETTGGCAHVVDATLDKTAEGIYTVSATVRSADTGWDKYADRWIVEGGGELLAERVLTHPHEMEQPFTRSLSGVSIPSEVDEVVIAAHDSVSGFCGETVTVSVPD